jgi:hypothetical protein
LKEIIMTNTTTNTCAACIAFDASTQYRCANLVTFRPLGSDLAFPPKADDCCPDFDARMVKLYRHPDTHAALSLERINGELFEYGVLIATDDKGQTVRVAIGPQGLVEVGQALARIGGAA